MVHHVSSSVSFFSGYLEFSPEFLQISVSSTNVIPLAMSEVRLPKIHVFLSLFLEIDSSESVALHLLVAHDEFPRQIAICNDNYFVAFSHNIFQKFAVVKEVMSIFPHEIVMTCTVSYMFL